MKLHLKGKMLNFSREIFLVFPQTEFHRSSPCIRQYNCCRRSSITTRESNKNNSKIDTNSADVIIEWENQTAGDESVHRERGQPGVQLANGTIVFLSWFERSSLKQRAIDAGFTTIPTWCRYISVFSWIMLTALRPFAPVIWRALCQCWLGICERSNR